MLGVRELLLVRGGSFLFEADTGPKWEEVSAETKAGRRIQEREQDWYLPGMKLGGRYR